MTDKKGTGNIAVTIEEARNLTATSKGTADPYVEIKWGKDKKKTTVKKKTLNPRWGETFIFKSNSSEMVIEVTSKSLIGRVTLSADKVFEEIDDWIPLLNKKDVLSGEIKIQTKVEGGSTVSKEKEKKKEKKKEHVGLIEEDITVDTHEDDDEIYIGQNDRLNEIRRASGITKLRSTDVLNQKFMDQFHDLVDTVRAPLRFLQANNIMLKKLYSQYFTSTTTEQRETVAEQMTALITANTTEGKKLGAKFKEIELSNIDASRSSNVKQAEVKIRSNIYNVLSKTYLDAMIEFQDIQSQYKATHKKTTRRLYKLTNPDATEEELEKAEEMEIDVVLQNAVIDQRKEKAKEALAYVKSKHREIIKIEQSLIEINRLFNEMAALVASQAEFIDRIQNNVTVTKINVGKGLEDLRKARHYQNHRFKITPVHLAKLITK